MGYSNWRITFLLALAVFWIGLSFGINTVMVNYNYGATWQIATVLSGWWIFYLIIARVLWTDDN